MKLATQSRERPFNSQGLRGGLLDPLGFGLPGRGLGRDRRVGGSGEEREEGGS